MESNIRKVDWLHIEPHETREDGRFLIYIPIDYLLPVLHEFKAGCDLQAGDCVYVSDDTAYPYFKNDQHNEIYGFAIMNAAANIRTPIAWMPNGLLPAIPKD